MRSKLKKETKEYGRFIQGADCKTARTEDWLDILFRKLLLLLIATFIVTCPYVQGQNISVPYDDVYVYLTAREGRTARNAYNLFIYNNSKDTVSVENFNRYIVHASTFNFIRQEGVAFFWQLLTLSNQKPEDIAIITGGSPNIRKLRDQVEGDNKTIVVPPDSLFISEVYMLQPISMAYPKGYYKLCLFCAKTNECIAEIIVRVESNRRRFSFFRFIPRRHSIVN
jgi:hypothetical protein